MEIGKWKMGKRTGPARWASCRAPIFHLPFSIFLLTAVVGVAPLSHAQGTGSGLPETLEAIERARVVTRILYVTAHPDDESSSILTYLARGLHADVALLSLTRGEGGQNALGPEQAPQLGVIRTEELLCATQQYGARLYFTRAPDFGYSKTPEETLRIWGDQVLDDMVAVLRHFRPHIVINNWGGVTTGHGHHQAAGLLVPRALEAAGMSEDVPVLDIWRGRFGETPSSENAIEIPADQISPLWGKSYNEIGLEGFVNHRTQGIVGFRGSRFFRGRRSLFPATSDEAYVRSLLKPATVSDYFDHVRGDCNGPKEANRLLSEALEGAKNLKWTETTGALAAAGAQVTKLMESFREGERLAVSDSREEQQLTELIRVRERLDRALTLAAGLRVQAEADRGELVAGEKFTVLVSWQRRAEVALKLGEPELLLPGGWQVTAKTEERGGGVRFTVQIPAGATAPHTEDEWMYPFPPALVHARLQATVEGYAFAVEADATAMHVTSTRADELPLTLVPAVTLTAEPRQFVIARGRVPQSMELVTRVRHYGSGPAEVAVALEAPAGWNVSPPLRVKFTGAGDQLVKFTVPPPRNPPAGSFPLRPVARMGGAEFRTSLEPLPTLPTRLWSEPAVASVRVFDLNVPAGLRVGYVAAENDTIPAALRQLGIDVTLLDEEALAFGDLRRFDAIAIGIRAYELREDLLRANQRLLDYCAAGGTLVVQYQRDSVWSRANPAPYPAKVADPTLRVSVEDAPVRVLAPAHAVLNLPNRIGPQDFDGWVQERGLYYWGEFDARYTPLLGMHDPGEEETNGSLVVAQHGRGAYIYTGLSFFRQLPEGVPGAYRLFVNLLSQSKSR